MDESKKAALNLEGVAALIRGETIVFRPHGHSMGPRIPDRALVTVAPIREDDTLNVGDVVFCRVNGALMLHIVKEIGGDGRVLIGNNKGKINGWTTRKQVYGRVVGVEP